MKKIIFSFVAVLLFAGNASALPFFDDFNASVVGLNVAPTGWTVINGTVDVVRHGTYSINCAGGSGLCVDLDGSTGNGGVLYRDVVAPAGELELTYVMRGNDRGGQADTVDIEIIALSLSGTPAVYSNTVTKSPFDPYEVFISTFILTDPSTLRLQFHDRGRDNVGMILENVGMRIVDDGSHLPPTPTPTPEPGTWVLMSTGLIGVLGYLRRQRKA